MLAGRVRPAVTSEQRKRSESKRPSVPGRLHIGGRSATPKAWLELAGQSWMDFIDLRERSVGGAQNPPVLRAPNATFTAERRKRRASFPSSEQFAASFVDLLRE